MHNPIPPDVERAVEAYMLCPLSTKLAERLAAYEQAVSIAGAHAKNEEFKIIVWYVTESATNVVTGLPEGVSAAEIEAAIEYMQDLNKRLLH